MNKKRRLEKILDMLKIDGTITIKEIIDELDISDMTARRDLDALEADGLLTRTHGGAQLLSSKKPLEKTHIEKKSLNTKEKIDIAKKACSLIKDGDTIFIGPGTTLEQLALELKGRKGYKIRVITNSLPVFLILNDSETIDLLLLGGEYREITGAFVSANAVTHNSIATYSDKEGVIQQLALNNAVEKFLLVDSTKFDRYDFFNFYNLDQLDTIITDNQISPQHLEEFSQYTTILKAD
ncbi:DeoR/GlpR family DNA-binding transcription regulator [Enterococcus faecium]|nr:DeoR/GlpR transcriptional regulator [Enterococcus faecium]HBL8311763.1 DeoR/GlpR transcriptional regulator [Enterococcus faecium]